MTADTRTSGEQALAVARLREVGFDLHTALDLVAEGCDAVTAGRVGVPGEPGRSAGMRPETVRRRVEAISRLTDDERAHSNEDELHLSVLRAIARGAADPRGLAREAIKTADMDFCRWYA